MKKIPGDIRKLHYALKNNKDYIGIIVEGSVVTADPWIKNKSDYDFIILLRRKNETTQKLLNNALNSLKLNDKLFFIFLTKHEFLRKRNNIHDFSNRFKTKTVFGTDLIKFKKLPSKREAKSIYSKELKGLGLKLEHRLINTSIWSIKKIRAVFWHQFKQIFRIMELKCYLKTGKYPNSRLDAAKALKSPELIETEWAIENISRIKRNKIIKITNNLINYLKENLYA